MMMKSIVTILIVAICVQCVLSAETSDGVRKNRPRRRRTISQSPSAIKTSVQSNNKGNETPDNVIEGERGTIKLDGKVVRADDEKFKNGSVDLRIDQGQIFINNNLIFTVKPTRPKARMTPQIQYHSVTDFKMEIFNRGEIKYTDNHKGITNFSF